MGKRGAAVLLGLLASGSTAADVAEARERPCRPHASRTWAVAGDVRVYRLIRGPRRGSVYACHRDVGRPLYLGLHGTVPDDYSVYAVRLAGDLVGYATDCACRETNYEPATVQVADVRRRRWRFYREYVQQPIGVRDLVLKRNGSLAWTTAEGKYEGERLVNDYAVWKHDADGEVLLDAGPEIDPLSLALDGDYLYWRNAGEARTATLR